MSWNEIDNKNDINLMIGIDGQLLWTCPRCMATQSFLLNIENLAFCNPEIKCKNTDICGDEQSVFELSIEINGRYKGLDDRPLK